MNDVDELREKEKRMILEAAADADRALQRLHDLASAYVRRGNCEACSQWVELTAASEHGKWNATVHLWEDAECVNASWSEDSCGHSLAEAVRGGLWPDAIEAREATAPDT